MSQVVKYMITVKTAMTYLANQWLTLYAEGVPSFSPGLRALAR